MASLAFERWFRASVILSLTLVLFALWFFPALMRANEDSIAFSSGHTVTNANGFLTHWRGMGGEATLGRPISQPLNENDLLVQYFERGRLELHPEMEGTPILLGRIGAEYAEALWLEFEAPALEGQPGSQYFDLTGYSLNEPFLSFWQQQGGIPMFGYPISEPRWEYIGNQMLQVQYFERGRLEYHPLAAGTGEAVRISPLGVDLALLRGIDLQPAAPPATPEPTAAPIVPTEPPPAPAPTAVPPSPAVVEARRPIPTDVPRKWGRSIVVDIGDQWLYAYEGDQLVFDAPISTGKDGFNTPIGNYAVYAKLRSQTMSGTLGGEYYNVPNVPHVMYINGGVAIHGTYWHNDFGTGIRRSHGCINLPLGSAEWLYSWAPMGTPVTVRW